MINQLHPDTLVNTERRFTFLPIAKVACSTLKHWFVTTGKEKPSTDHWKPGEIHNFVRSQQIGTMGRLTGFMVAAQFNHFCFVRNPWDRIVSAYTEKFVGPNPLNFANKPVIEAIARKSGVKLALTADYPYSVGNKDWVMKIDPQIDYGSYVSFREFVAFICSKEDAELDQHWRPQTSFTRRTSFRFIGKTETFDQDIQEICDLLKVSPPEASLNRTNYSAGSTEELWDANPATLRKIGIRPGPRNLYSREIFDQVTARYKGDWQAFDYNPEDYWIKRIQSG